MAYNFPNSPIINDIYTPPGGPSWKWNGTGWTEVTIAATGIEEAPVDSIEYVRKNAAWAVNSGLAPAWASISGKPSTFPPDAHTHAYSSLTGVPVAFPPIAHVHPTSEVTGLDAAQTAQDTAIGTKLNTSAYTAADVLTKIKTVDGTSSGLDADLLDGNDSAFYATASSVTGKLDASAYTAADVLAKLITVDGTGSGLDADLLDGNSSAAFATLASPTFTGKVTIPPSTFTPGAGLNIGGGTGPQTPVLGDFWLTSGGTLQWYGATTMTAVVTNASQSISSTKTFTVPPIMATPTTAIASIRLPHGVAPSAPTNGDFWSTTTGFYAQVNGVTVGPLTGVTDISGKENTIAAGTAAQYWQGTKTWQTLDKAAVGLGNVDNTSDANKPVSTAQATADGLALPKTGGTMTGDLTIAKATPTIEIQKAASGQEGAINFRTGSGAAGLRWKLAYDNVAEAGANAGSNLNLSRYDDAGALLNNPLAFTRDTGRITFNTTVAGGVVLNSTGTVSVGGRVAVAFATALPAGGAVGTSLLFSNVSIGVYAGSGVPTVSAAKGSLYLRSDGTSNVTRMYVNTDGAATWTAVNTVA